MGEDKADPFTETQCTRARFTTLPCFFLSPLTPHAKENAYPRDARVDLGLSGR